MMISLVPSSETGSRKLQKIYLDHTFLRLPVAPLGQFSAPEDALGLQSSDRATAFVYA